MLSSVTLAFILGSAAVLATPVNNTAVERLCGTVISDEDFVAAEAHFAANAIPASNSTLHALATIPVYYHVIMASTSLSDGNVP